MMKNVAMPSFYCLKNSTLCWKEREKTPDLCCFSSTKN